MSETDAIAKRRETAPWVSFEGIEGSGKSTQIELLARTLGAAGVSLVVTREPGGTALGLRLRSALLESTESAMHPLAELLLYVADRVQHLTEVVLPAIGRGDVVLCDRYLDATLAYQGYGRGLDMAFLEAIHRHAPLDARPDRTVLLDIDAAVGLSRARRRNCDLGLERTEGRFEAEELAFHHRVREGYLALAAADSTRFRIVEADGDAALVAERVRHALQDLLPPSPPRRKTR